MLECHTLRVRERSGCRVMVEEVLPSAPHLSQKGQEDSAPPGLDEISTSWWCLTALVALFPTFKGMENESVAVTRKGN